LLLLLIDHALEEANQEILHLSLKDVLLVERTSADQPLGIKLTICLAQLV